MIPPTIVVPQKDRESRGLRIFVATGGRRTHPFSTRRTRSIGEEHTAL